MNKRVLIIRLSALGDVAMTIPVIYSVAKQNPQCQFYVLTRPFFTRLFVNCPANVSLIKVDYMKQYHGIVGTFRLLKHLSSLGIDKVVDLHNVSRSWLIDAFFRLKGKPVVMVDKDRKARRQLLKRKDGSVKPQENYVSRYVETFRRMGLSFKLDFKSLFSSVVPDLPDFVQNNQSKKIGIAPFARYANKTYPIEKMYEVVSLLSRHADYEIFVFGGRNEASFLNGWKSTNVHVLAGQLNLEDELVVMSVLDLMVSMDSANMHLASLVGTKVLSLWGSTTPACGFLGYGQKEEDALYLHLPCQPCSIAGGKDCHVGGMPCFNDLSPKIVVQKIIQLTDRK